MTPTVLVFDVNETLLDITALEPVFARIFGDPRIAREWFGQLVTYSVTLTLSDVPPGSSPSTGSAKSTG